MKKRFLLSEVCILIIAVVVIVSAAIAEEIVTRHSLWWEAADWETTWVQLESENPITAIFTGTLQVRRPSGQIVFSQDFDTTCAPGEEPGLGRCGALADHVINTDDFEREDLELWSRSCWMVTGQPEPLCSIYIPDNCDLAGIGCTIVLSGTKVTIPDPCRAAIEACGTVQDSQGFWRIRTFRGTKPYGICIPGLVIQEE